MPPFPQLPVQDLDRNFMDSISLSSTIAVTISAILSAGDLSIYKWTN